MEKNKKSPIFSIKYLAYDFVKYSAAPSGLLWFRTKYLYENDDAKKKIRGGAVVITNHNGFFDPIYLMFAIWYRRHHFVCREDLYRFPLTWFLCIPINRENTSMASFKGITEHLKMGDVVSLFPEGGVNRDDKVIASFKSGMVLMALRANVPIIPVYILKKDKWYHRMRVGIGGAVDVKSICGGMPSLTQIDEIAERIHSKEEYLRNLCINDKEKNNV